MRHFLTFVLFGIIISNTQAQSCGNNGERYKDEIFKNTELALIQGAYGVHKRQEYLAVYPKKSIDCLEKRPIVLLIHGGGFVGGNHLFMTDLATEFARKGYVAVAISYALAPERIAGEYGICYQPFTMYTSYQDCRAASKFILSNAKLVGGDTDKFFVYGASAGAVNTLHLAYIQEDDIPGVVAEYGSVDARCIPSVVNQPIKIAGIVSRAGALAVDHVFTDTDNVPAFFYHGNNDHTVPYETYWPSSMCSDKLKYYFYGPKWITQQVKNRVANGGIPMTYQFFTGCNIGHSASHLPEMDVFMADIIAGKVPETFEKTINASLRPELSESDELDMSISAANNNDSLDVKAYDLSGRPIDKYTKGQVIIWRYSDGSTSRVFFQ